MSRPESIEELRDNFDIPDYDEWANDIVDLAKELRNSDGKEGPKIIDFPNSKYRVTVDKIDTVED